MKEITSQCEQNLVMQHCINREIVRPNTSVILVIKYLIFLEMIVFGLYNIVGYLLAWLDISFRSGVLYVAASIIVILFYLKRSLILAVELYQHYATDETRRKCTLLPSCSEYAIMALNKYGAFKGLYLSCVRVFKTCKGDYRIDYP